jgi:hypothetical protein
LITVIAVLNAMRLSTSTTNIAIVSSSMFAPPERLPPSVKSLNRSGGTRVREILDQALRLPAVGRTPYLDQVCGSDARLRGEVESLLAVIQNLVRTAERRFAVDDPFEPSE